MTRKASRATGGHSADATRHTGASGDDTAHSSPFKIERHVFYWMTQVVSRRDRQLNAELRRFRLRVPEYRVLGILRARQRLSLGEAAMTIGLDYTTMSRTVDRMVKAGRVLRVTDTTDRRVTRLALTAEGTRLFDHIWPMVSRLNDVACARLPEGAMPLLCHTLGEMVRSLEDSWRDRGDAENAIDAAC